MALLLSQDCSTLAMICTLLSVKQGGIKYHFKSLWYNTTWDWTQVSRTIGEHAAHKANEPVEGEQIWSIFIWETTWSKLKPCANHSMIFVAASHQTGLDTRSKARRPIKVGIKGCERSGTSWDSNPAGTIYQPLRSGRIWHKVNF